MKKILAGFMILSPLLLIVSALAQTAPPAGTWAQIKNTKVVDALDMAHFYPPYNPRDVFAYSGGDLVQINGVWGMAITGGGHAATPDNSTIFVPFDGAGPRLLQPPYVSPDGIYKYDVPYDVYKPAGLWTDARKSVHTYSSFLTIQKGGRPFLYLSGGSTMTGGGGGTAMTRLFDLSQTPAQAAARPDLGWLLMAPAPRSNLASSSGWDPVQKRVVVRGTRFIGAYYPDTDRWENWNIHAASFCCDYAASVAMDVAGRKMYVLGNRLAEMIDLDTKAYTPLNSKPWASHFVTGPYLPGPGVSWHARTKQIVAWVGGNNLILIDPATDRSRIVAMGGVTVTRASGSGTYGRFRLIPGTDQVVLVNEADQDVFIGTVPFDGAPPPPPPPPPPTGAVALTATPSEIANGQSSVLTLRTPTLDYHNVFINGVRPAGVTSGTSATWTLTVRPTVTTVYQAVATNAADVPYAMPSVTVTVQSAPQPPRPPPPPVPPASSPGTISVLPGQPIPARQWVERPVSARWGTFGGDSVARVEDVGFGSSKHARMFYHPGLKAMVVGGGDRIVSMPRVGGPNGTGSEIISLNAQTDRWTTLRPFCVPGEPQPGRPDTVGWAYDSLRNRGLMTPGFYFITQGNLSSGCGAIEGWGAYAFDFATGKFAGPDAAAGLPPPPGGWGGDMGASYATYNPTRDEYVRVYGSQLQRLNLATKQWTIQYLSLPGDTTWQPWANRRQLVIDVAGQALYFVQPPTSLIKISLTNAAVTSIPLPTRYAPPPGDSDVYLAFDPQARVVMLPNNIDMAESPLAGLGLYPVETGQWEWLAVPLAVTGSVWGFDENLGVLVGIGKRRMPNAYFLYKYGTNVSALPPSTQMPRRGR